MITKTIQIQEITVDEFTDKVAEKLMLKMESYLKELATNNDNELLTRKETAKYLKINLATLWHWTNKGKLISYGIGNRRYYKKQEVIAHLILI